MPAICPICLHGSCSKFSGFYQVQPSPAIDIEVVKPHIAFFNPRSKPLESLAESIASISVAGSPIKLQSSIKNLGVYLDSRMSFDRQVSETCKASYFHIRALRHIRPSLTAKSKSFSSVASSVWNKLPGHLSSISSLPAFRKKLKHHLFRSAFPGNPSPSTGITFCDVSPSTDATQVGHTPPPG